jgi:hypothetical protein
VMRAAEQKEGETRLMEGRISKWGGKITTI